MPRRRRLALPIAIAAAGAAAAVALPIIASSAPTAPRLPDLDATGATAQQFLPGADYAGETGVQFSQFDTVNGLPKFLVRFNGWVYNNGTGPLDFRGNPQLAEGTAAGMSQYLYRDSSNAVLDRQSTDPAKWLRVQSTNPGDAASYHPNVPEFVYDNSDSHRHFHLQRVAEYSLWNQARTAMVTPANKTGFCLYDISDDGTPNGPGIVYGADTSGGFCRQNQPGATDLREGISEGWADLYDLTLDYQWIDITNVAPGNYSLALRLDPENVVKESNEANNGYAYGAGVTVPGYRAKAVTTSTAYRTPKLVTLAADRFAFSGANYQGQTAPSVSATPRYRVEKLPANGTLNNDGNPLTVGSTLPANDVNLTYVPNNNFGNGQDSFQFSALNTSFGYPLTPAVATATVTVGNSGIGVGLTGAPGRLTVGTQAQLTATGGGPGGVSWSVNGVPGGNASVGTVSPTGLYTAPATVPPGGSVTVRVTAKDDITRFVDAAIAIDAAQNPGPIPIVTPPVTSTGVLGRPGLLVNGRNVTATYRPGAAGRLTVTLLHRGTRVGACSLNAAANQLVTCRARMPRAWDPATVTLRAVLKRADTGRTVTQTSKAGPARGNFGRVAVRVRRGKVSLAVSPSRPGTVRATVTSKGRLVARCTGRVMSGQSLTCTRTVARKYRGRTLGVGIRFTDNQGATVYRDLSVR
jgi:hypothetical protein